MQPRVLRVKAHFVNLCWYAIIPRGWTVTVLIAAQTSSKEGYFSAAKGYPLVKGQWLRVLYVLGSFWCSPPTGIFFWLCLGRRVYLVLAPLCQIPSACNWRCSAPDKISLYHHRPPPSRPLVQYPSNKRCAPFVVPSWFASSGLGGLASVEFSPHYRLNPSHIENCRFSVGEYPRK